MPGQKSVNRTLDAVAYDAETIIVDENSAEFSVQNFVVGQFHLKTENAGGTTPTFDCKLQTKMPNGDWVDVPDMAFTQTATNVVELIDNIIKDTTNGLAYIQPLGKICRFAITITGTSPTFDVTLGYILKSS
jgi:hypothetical protein